MAGCRYEKIESSGEQQDSSQSSENIEAAQEVPHDFRNVTSTNRRWSSRQCVLLALQAIFLTINLAFLSLNLFAKRIDHPLQPYSPARSSVRHSIEQIDTYDMHSSPFIGEPGKQLDEAWSDLLRSTNIRISEEEMRKMNKTSVALKDGDGYLGYLEVHHMLHCLKRFKQFRHLEHYPELDHKTFDLAHWDHCIEVVRRGIMCNADLMIDTLEWNDDGTWLQGSNRWPRVCANWDSIQAFADSRAVDVDRSNPLDGLWPSDDERSFGPVDLTEQ